MHGRIVNYLLNIILLSLLVICITIVSRAYVSSERYFYYWDYAMYQQMSTDQVYTAKASMPAAVNNIVKSMGDDYNKLFTLPLIPVLNLTGKYFLRSSYIFSLSLVYLLPYFLLTGLVTRKIIYSQPRIIFWIAVLIAFLTPAAWLPTLRGYPDSGGACLIIIALWAYLYDPKLKKWWQILLIGISLAMAVLFRRHYAYAATAFLATVAIVILVNFFSEFWRKQTSAVRTLMYGYIRLGFVVLTSLVVFLTVGYAFVQNVVHGKSQLLYTAWQTDPLTVFQSFRIYYGWLGLLLATTGFILGIILLPQSRTTISLAALFGGISTLQWLFWVRQPNPQYTLHFTTILLLGMIILLTIAWSKFIGIWRLIGIAVLVIYIVFNAIIGMAPQLFPSQPFLRSTFAAQTSPLQLPDYTQIVNLIHQLHNLSAKREPMAVIASSGYLNYDLLSAADHALYPSKPLKLIFAPEIDTRDYYPIEVLLQARYLILANPLQVHLAPSEQDVLRTIYQAFIDRWEITNNYTRLPGTYKLTDNVQVDIFQRTQDIDFEVAIRTLVKIQESVGPRPIHQPEWLRLDGFTTNLVTFPQGKYRLQATLTKPANFLYLGNLPTVGKITGSILLKNPACGTVSLSLAAISDNGGKIQMDRLEFQAVIEQLFSIDFHSQDFNFLLLTLTQEKTSSEPCQVTVKQIQIIDDGSGT